MAEEKIKCKHCSLPLSKHDGSGFCPAGTEEFGGKKMTEETLKCPFCEEELLEIDKHKKIYDCQGKIQLLNLTLDCIAHDLYLQGWEDLVYKIISIKQKSYQEGYEKGKEDERKKAEKDLAFCRREHLEAIKFYEEKLEELK